MRLKKLTPYRANLAPFVGKRAVFEGVFVRYGASDPLNMYDRQMDNILLRRLIDEEGNHLVEHIWIKTNKAIDSLDLKGGERIRFNARVDRCEKGYKGRNWLKSMRAPLRDDFELVGLRHVIVVGKKEDDKDETECTEA